MLGDRVHFLGWATDLPALYGALDVVVLTSRNEGTPVALIEAAAAGRPVVATAVGGVPEVVKDGQTGFLRPAGDAEGLAGKVGMLLEHPEAGRALGLAGREWVRSRYSAERLVEDLASCTRSCWSGGSPEVGTEVPRIRWRLLGGLPWPVEQRAAPIAAPSNLPSARGG